MVTLERPAYYSAQRYSEYCGLSTDDKATIKAGNGDEFYEIDTGKIYKYNATSNEWVVQPDDTAPIDTGLPTITSETAGHFLSNDGNVTHWQDIASADFIITLTDKQNGNYTADKTYVEIKRAYDAKENIAVNVNGNSRLPLMCVEFADENSAVFTFGYTDIRTGGQIITTRSITYTHNTSGDSWVDSDDEADLSTYLPLTGGVVSGALSVLTQPTQNDHVATKSYVDGHNFVVTLTQDETAGFNADKTIQEIAQASLSNKYIHAELNGDIYMLSTISAAEAIFSRVEDNKIQQIMYANNAWTKTEKAMLPLSGGKMSGGIDMQENAITNVQKLHIDGQASLYLGQTIEKSGTQGVRLTGTTNNQAAFVKPDKQTEYVPVSVGTPSSPNHAVTLASLTQEVLADAPTADGCIANKKYVDDCVNTRLPIIQANQGQLKAYLQNGANPDTCIVSNSGMAQCIARYTANGHLIDQGQPTENNQLANKKYVDDKIASYNQRTGDFAVSGNLTVNGIASVIKEPEQNVDVTNKGYVDTQIGASVADKVKKQSVAVSGSSSVNVPLSNGVYLVTVSDNAHGGLICVSVFPDGEIISGLVDLNGWKCEKLTNQQGVVLSNVAVSDMTVYITSIGED